MEQQLTSKSEVFLAGLGGMGVLLAGQLLAWAALQHYKYVSWLPSYGVQPRGGLSECTVIFSNEEISSPVLDQARAVLLFDGSQFKVMEPRVRPDGIMVVDKSGLQEKKEREDITLLAVPAMETAISIFGDAGPSNLIQLGVYIGATQAVPAELIEGELQKRFGAKEAVFARNIKAFKQGLEMDRNIKV